MPAQSSFDGFELRVEDDGAIAKVVLRADADPASLSHAAILQLVHERGVIGKESLSALIDQAIADFKREPRSMEIVIAEAVPVRNGRNGSIEWQPGYDPHAQAAAAPAEGKIDYYNQAHYVTVSAGTQIATIHQPTPGSDGHDVTGHIRKAKPGTPLQLKTDQTVTIDQSGRVIALINGIVRYERGVLCILPLFEVQGSVDFSTGNIAFKGCVNVHGDVRDRFVVRADQDLTVNGLIGAATIICGRNLQAQCGMAAHERGCLYVGADATAGYLNNVHGLVQGNLIVRREIINSDLAIGRNLVCEGGAVIGGSIAINGTAVIGTLGSPKGTATVVAFGSHACQQQIDQLIRSVPGRATAGEEQNAREQQHLVFDEIRSCTSKACEFTAGRAKSVDLAIMKALCPGVVIKTGRLRVAVHRGMNGPIRISGDQQSGLVYRMADGVSHPLTDLARPFEKAG